VVPPLVARLPNLDWMTIAGHLLCCAETITETCTRNIQRTSRTVEVIMIIDQSSATSLLALVASKTKTTKQFIVILYNHQSDQTNKMLECISDIISDKL